MKTSMRAGDEMDLRGAGRRKIIGVRNSILVLVTAVLAVAMSFAQGRTGIDEHGVYRNAEVGFAFTPPTGLTDVTAKANAAGKDDANTIALLLFELSGPDSNDLDWRGIAVQSYPRARVDRKDDLEAEAGLSRRIVGKAPMQVGATTRVTIAGQTYALCQYEQSKGLLTQYAHVYTTVIHGQLVAFAFTGNSPATLEQMSESLKTLAVKSDATGN